MKNDNELLKKIESLEKQVDELEKELGKYYGLYLQNESTLRGIYGTFTWLQNCAKEENSRMIKKYGTKERFTAD